jgi:predicted transposase YdaD
MILLGVLKPGQKARIKLLPNEVTVSAKLPDSTYLVTLESGEQRLVHIEAQTVYDPQIQRRMAEYAMRLWIKYGLPVDSYLLLLTSRKVPTPIPNLVHIKAGGLDVKLHYHVLPLWRVSARKMLQTDNPFLLPFLPLMKDSAPVMEQVARRLAAVADPKRKSELSVHFVALSGLRYNPLEVLDLIRSTDMLTYDQLKESSVIQYVAKEVAEEMVAKKIARRLAREGARKFAEGRAETAAQMLTIAAQQRFPRLELGDQLKRIHDADALQALFVELYKIKSAKAFLRRLAELAANQTTTHKRAKKNGTNKK